MFGMLQKVNTCFFFGYGGKSLNRFGKKIEALGKQRECDDVGKWEKKIINHLYSCGFNSNQRRSDKSEVVISLENHMHNVHHGHGMKFPK